MQKSLGDIRKEISAVNSEAEWLCDEFDDHQLAWRPGIDRWSIAENLEHLNLTTRILLNTVEQAVETGLRSKFQGGGSISLGLVGSIQLWRMEPPVKFARRAPDAVWPGLKGAVAGTLDRFLDSQDSLLGLVDRAADVDCGLEWVHSPLATLPSANLISCFALLVAHQRRHLAQAGRVKTQVGGRMDVGGRIDRPRVEGSYAE